MTGSAVAQQQSRAHNHFIEETHVCVKMWRGRKLRASLKSVGFYSPKAELHRCTDGICSEKLGFSLLSMHATERGEKVLSVKVEFGSCDGFSPGVQSRAAGSRVNAHPEQGCGDSDSLSLLSPLSSLPPSLPLSSILRSGACVQGTPAAGFTSSSFSWRQQETRSSDAGGSKDETRSL